MRLLTPYLFNKKLSEEFNDNIWNEFDRFFDDLAVAPSRYFEHRGLDLATDMIEAEDHFMLSVDLPGLKKEDVKIEINDNILTLSGERKREYSSDKKQTVQRFEKAYGSFKKSYALPKTINADKIEARFENGVLEIYLPKVAAAQSRTIEIQAPKGGFFEKLLGGKKVNSEMKDVTDSVKSA